MRVLAALALALLGHTAGAPARRNLGLLSNFLPRLCMTSGLLCQGAPSAMRMVGVLAALALALLGASLAQRRAVVQPQAPRRRPPVAAKQAAALCGLQVCISCWCSPGWCHCIRW